MLERSGIKFDAEPIANQARIRALLWCYIFALIGKQRPSLRTVVLDDPISSLDHTHRTNFSRELIGQAVKENQLLIGSHDKVWIAEAMKGPLSPLKKIELLSPLRANQTSVLLRPLKGDLLSAKQVYESVRCDSNACFFIDRCRLWIESELKLLLSYSSTAPRDMATIDPLIIQMRKTISDEVIFSDNVFEKMISFFDSGDILSILNRSHHDCSSITTTDADNILAHFSDFKQFDECFDLIARKVKNIRCNRPDLRINHASSKTVFDLSHRGKLKDRNLQIVGKAAAASSGRGAIISYDSNPALIKLNMPDAGFIRLTSDSLSPVAKDGDWLVCEKIDSPNANDLVVAQTEVGRLARRAQSDEAAPGWWILNGINPVNWVQPYFAPEERMQFARIVGVLFNTTIPPTKRDGDNEFESDEIPFPEPLKSELNFIEVRGSSAEPLALNGQYLHVRECSDFTSIPDGSLVCVTVEDEEGYFKRLRYVPGFDNADGRAVVLESLNSTNPEPPIPAFLPLKPCEPSSADTSSRPAGIRPITKVMFVTGVIFDLPGAEDID